MNRMTKLQTVIRGISQLNGTELEQVLKEILARIDRTKRMETAIDQFIGSGKGVWTTDAQQYVDDLRADDRL